MTQGKRSINPHALPGKLPLFDGSGRVCNRKNGTFWSGVKKCCHEAVAEYFSLPAARRFGKMQRSK
jgi:hypothetical protein